VLRFELEITPFDSECNIDGLSRGHMTVRGSEGSVTSKTDDPNQSIMIFHSIVELLDGLRRFVLSEDAGNYRFVGVDNSFQFTTTKSENDRVKLNSAQVTIDEVPTTEMVLAVWTGVSAFLSHYGEFIEPDDPISDDLRAALDSFLDAFRSVIEPA
jgi:hypothetical protein